AGGEIPVPGLEDPVHAVERDHDLTAPDAVLVLVGADNLEGPHGTGLNRVPCPGGGVPDGYDVPPGVLREPVAAGVGSSSHHDAFPLVQVECCVFGVVGDEPVFTVMGVELVAQVAVHVLRGDLVTLTVGRDVPHSLTPTEQGVGDHEVPVVLAVGEQVCQIGHHEPVDVGLVGHVTHSSLRSAGGVPASM